MSERARKSPEREEYQYFNSSKKVKKNEKSNENLYLENRVRNLELQLEEMTKKYQRASRENLKIDEFEIKENANGIKEELKNIEIFGDEDLKENNNNELRNQIYILNERVKWKEREIEFLNSRFKKYELGISK